MMFLKRTAQLGRCTLVKTDRFSVSPIAARIDHLNQQFQGKPIRMGVMGDVPGAKQHTPPSRGVEHDVVRVSNAGPGAAACDLRDRWRLVHHASPLLVRWRA
jgi:hypothetical protein